MVRSGEVPKVKHVEPPAPVNVRDQLLNEIKSFGGKNTLKKVLLSEYRTQNLLIALIGVEQQRLEVGGQPSEDIDVDDRQLFIISINECYL